MDELFENESPLQESFNNAAQHLKSLVDRLSSEDLLFFYARYKQATVGPCNSKRPGMFDFQGKQKWDAWKKLGSMESEQAMQEYVSHMDEVDDNWRDSKSSKAGLGVGVSTMYNKESEINDSDKTMFDWCKEGNVEKLQGILSSSSASLNDLDESGLALIHWACDRGCIEVIDLLARLQADMNLPDIDGQTPLHYAASCDHVSIVQRLLEHGADARRKDGENQFPADTTDNPEILEILSKTCQEVT